MSQLTDLEVQRLRRIASDLREVFAERGYRIDSAMDVDFAFGSGVSRAALARDLAIDAASESASRVGLDFRPVNGAGREFRSFSDGVDRRYRLRRARRDDSGAFTVVANSSAAVMVADESLIPEEFWVLAYVLSDSFLVENVFAAQILGLEDGRPGRLILGKLTQLLGPDAPTGGFKPTDEELPGFEDDEEGDGDTGLL
ncbi:hypothetical protein [Blastococcus aurantiacus]|uniref:hypothetical protein n=1 Tax=Blastococcus aurantiacus TaxID=1550231 RepID=UPI000B87B961|nr:hypothetical protein [Blastococcus aurantiacus]